MLGRKGHSFVAECPNNALILTVKCASIGLVLRKCPSSGLLSKISFVLCQKIHFYQNVWLLNLVAALEMVLDLQMCPTNGQEIFKLVEVG